MPRFADQLQEFLKGRNGLNGYFSMITVRIGLQKMSKFQLKVFKNPLINQDQDTH